MIEEEDRKLIQSVVEFGDKVVREVMTPRPNIVAISADATLEQLRQLVITEQYSRIPVYEQTIDQVIGFVHVRDMFELEEEEREHGTVRELVRTIRLVPETKPVSDLMRQMQQENSHMVIVVDEYGNTAGLATMEDLLEVIIGEIRDEHEPESDVTEDGQWGLHRLREASTWIASPTWWRTSTARKISNPPRWAGWSANGWGTCPRRERASTATAYAWKYWSPMGCASPRSASAGPKRLLNEQN